MASVACEEAKENTNTIQIHHPNMRFPSTEKPMAKKRNENVVNKIRCSAAKTPLARRALEIDDIGRTMMSDRHQKGRL